MKRKIFYTLTVYVTTICSYAQSFDDLVKVHLDDSNLTDFIAEFAELHSGEKGVYVLKIFQKDADKSIYELQFTTWWYPYENDVASMVYTEVDGNLVFIYSGIERLFPSHDRYQSMQRLIRTRIDKVYKQGDVPPTGILPSRSIVICGGTKVFEAQHGLILPDEYSCVSEAPPLKDKN